jgi:hypothetical protein
LFIFNFVSVLVSFDTSVRRLKPFEDRIWTDLYFTRTVPQSAAVAEEETEGAVLVGTSTADGVHAWSLLGGLLNRVCFIIAALVYVFIFVRCFA